MGNIRESAGCCAKNTSHIKSNEQSAMLLNISLISFKQLTLNNGIQGNRISAKKVIKFSYISIKLLQLKPALLFIMYIKRILLIEK